MDATLAKQEWKSHRWEATDGQLFSEKFIPIPRPWQSSQGLPELTRKVENDPNRRTNRMELACLSSWQLLIESLAEQYSPSNWFLLMEDDVGSSLAVPDHWPYRLTDVINQAGESALAIQLSPINGYKRRELYEYWKEDKRRNLVLPKSKVRSHGNGALLLHRDATRLLARKIGRWIEYIFPSFHILGHPRNVRPVADKWLYASLPKNSCWVSTFPIFCLEAQSSSLHKSHVKTFHNASKLMTLEIWKEGGHSQLIKAFHEWNEIE